MADLSVATRKKTSDQIRLVGCCTPWPGMHAVGVGSPLELRSLREFEKHGFFPKKQVPVPDPEHPISIADFAVPEKRLAIYIDGATFHVGERLRKYGWIREQVRKGESTWTVVELRVGDLRGNMVKAFLD